MSSRGGVRRRSAMMPFSAVVDERSFVTGNAIKAKKVIDALLSGWRWGFHNISDNGSGGDDIIR